MSCRENIIKTRKAKIKLAKSVLGIKTDQALMSHLGHSNRKSLHDFKFVNNKSARIEIVLDLIIENYRLKNKLNTIWKKPKRAKVLGIKKIVFNSKSVEEQIELSVKGQK